MASNSNENEDEITGINVTPLVDVMLVLLVIFMATATYIAERSIKISLPEADTGLNQELPKSLSFTLDKESQLYLDGKRVLLTDISNLIQATKDKLNQQTTIQALISADKTTPHGSVIKLIDEVRKNGINDFAIHVESSKK